MYTSIPSAVALGINKAHHQSGAFSSQSEATRSEIQPIGRWLATKGMRCSSAGVCGNLAVVTLVDINEPPSARRVRRPFLHAPPGHKPAPPNPDRSKAPHNNQACLASGCALVPG